jgi:phospholipid transport system substrate-binding protein
MQINKKTLTTVLMLLSLSGTTLADDKKTARQLVDTFQNQLIGVMQAGKQLGYAGRYAKLYDAVTQSHDLAKIARIIVGKEWEKLTEAQQKQLNDVFIKLSVASYAHNFKDYAGESFIFDNEEETARGGVIIHSHLTIPEEKDVKFDYMLKDDGDNWRIINIIANGVSDLALKRSEYTSILQRDGFNALIAKINEKIDSYSKI